MTTGVVQLGNVTVLSSDALLDPEQYAEFATNKIIFVGDRADQMLGAQARVMRNDIKQLLTNYFTLVIQATRTDILRSLDSGNKPSLSQQL